MADELTKLTDSLAKLESAGLLTATHVTAWKKFIVDKQTPVVSTHSLDDLYQAAAIVGGAAALYGFKT